MLMQVVFNEEFLGIIFLLVLWLFFTFLGMQRMNFIIILFALITAIVFTVALTNWIGIILIAFSIIMLFSAIASGRLRL